MLKFEGIHVGTKIRAYDFQPTADRPDMYVEGVITDAGMTPEGFKAYTVDVSNDTVFKNDPRTTVFVPMEVGMFEYDERIVVLKD